MIDHVWSVLCVDSSIDRETNLISLFSVAEQLEIGTLGEPPTDAVIPVDYQLISFWVRKEPGVPARGVARVQLLPPIGEEVHAAQELDVDLTTFERMRTIIRFSALPLRTAGRYWFVTQFKGTDSAPWETVSRVPLNLVIKQRDGAP